MIHARTRRQSILVTTPARTIIDLRRCVPADRLRSAIREAGVLGLSFDDAVGPDPTRSELEHLFLRLCRRHRLPLPEANQRIGRYEVDFLWRDRSLIVETDGYRYHRGRQAFEETAFSLVEDRSSLRGRKRGSPQAGHSDAVECAAPGPLDPGSWCSPGSLQCSNWSGSCRRGDHRS